MSGVLHPVGPEPERTYWLRRAALLMVLVLLVGALIGVAGLFGGGSSATAEPAAGATTPPATEATTPAAPSATPTAIPTATPTDSSTASTTASSSATSTATPPLKPSASASGSASASPNAKSALPTAAPKPAACAASALRPTLMGARRLKVDQDTTFSLSLINGGSVACTVTVSPASFELKIYSGTDRIWSTDDCAKAVRTASATLAPEKALSWKQTWNGRRSAAKCGATTALPRPGVYWATAQYTGAKPVQLRMIVR